MIFIRLSRPKEVVVQERFAEPSAITGVARLVDPLNTLNEYRIVPGSGSSADRDALRGDWKVVGKEMRKAVRKHGEKLAR